MKRRRFLFSAAQLGIWLGASGVNSVSMAASPEPTPLRPVRFGTRNGPRTGAYDTHGKATDGQFGPFIVEDGVIIPGAELREGSYDVAGFPVVVSRSVVAVASQREFDALDESHYGLTIVVRAGSRLVWNHNRTSGAGQWGRRASMQGSIIEGDGDDPRIDVRPTSDMQAHFDHIWLRSCADVTLSNLRIVPSAFREAKVCVQILEAESKEQTLKNVTVVGCLLKTSTPSLSDNFSEGGFPGGHGILCQANVPVGAIQIRDNRLYGNRRGIELPAARDWVEIVGNWIDMNYEDFIKINRQVDDCPIIVAGNYVTRPLGLGKDAGNPHTDMLQFQGGNLSNANIVIEANACFPGPARARNDVQVWYLAGNRGSGFSALLRANFSVDRSVRSCNVSSPNGSRTEWCATIPNQSLKLPYGGAWAGHRYDGAVRGNNQIRNSFFGDMLDGNGIEIKNCRRLKRMSPATLRNALPAYPLNEGTIPDMAALLRKFSPRANGPLAGIGPAAVLMMEPGAERSRYVMSPVAAPKPHIVLDEIVPSRRAFQARFTTDVDLNPVFWVVVPVGLTIRDAESVKKRYLARAFDHGYAKVGLGHGGISLAISGQAGTLQPNTEYELALAQENGWTVASDVVRARFRTLA